MVDQTWLFSSWWELSLLSWSSLSSPTSGVMLHGSFFALHQCFSFCSAQSCFSSCRGWLKVCWTCQPASSNLDQMSCYLSNVSINPGGWTSGLHVHVSAACELANAERKSVPWLFDFAVIPWLRILIPLRKLNAPLIILLPVSFQMLLLFPISGGLDQSGYICKYPNTTYSHTI